MSVGELLSTTPEITASAEATHAVVHAAGVTTEVPAGTETASLEGAAIPPVGTQETPTKLPWNHPLRRLQDDEAAAKGPNYNAARFTTYY